MKRIFDIVISFIGLLILSPILLVIALLIKLESRGPVFYRGERVGKDGKIFRIYKFRSMIVDADKVGGSTTSGKDQRVTGVGKVVRKYKLDELSQLINVLFGDMSMVWPRPQVQWAVDTYNEDERRILQLRPGITDWASIKFHNEGEIIANSGMADPDEAYMKLIHSEKTRLQLRYLKEHNIWIDIQIIFQTAATLFVTRV